jgi:hypothetical protein
VFLNIVLDEAVEEKANGDKVQIGMVVRLFNTSSGPYLPRQVIRGNSVVMLEVDTIHDYFDLADTSRLWSASVETISGDTDRPRRLRHEMMHQRPDRRGQRLEVGKCS